jgi:hypothetical protein
VSDFLLPEGRLCVGEPTQRRKAWIMRLQPRYAMRPGKPACELRRAVRAPAGAAGLQQRPHLSEQKVIIDLIALYRALGGGWESWTDRTGRGK